MAKLSSQFKELRDLIDGLQELTKYKLYVGATENMFEIAKGADGLYKGGKITLGEIVYLNEFGYTTPNGEFKQRSLVQEPLESEMVKNRVEKLLGDGMIGGKNLADMISKRKHKEALNILGEEIAGYLRWNWETGGLLSDTYDDLSHDYQIRKIKKGYDYKPLVTIHQLGKVFGYEVKR